MDEMRAIYRKKLNELVSEQVRGKPGMNAREELIRDYTEKEIQLTDKIERELKINKQIKNELLSLKSYTRQIKNLAEDWAPVGVPLPDILTAEAPLSLDNANYNSDQGELLNENDRLRKRNRKLEEEMKVIQDQLLN